MGAMRMRLSRVMLSLISCVAASTQAATIAAAVGVQAGATAARDMAPDGHVLAAANAADTLRYIHSAWGVLERRTTDCRALIDTKIDMATAEHPVLYVPHGMAIPSEAAAAARRCHARVLELPRVIERIGDVRPEELPHEGLLYLPRPYIVPGERFNEMYGWDSYFILLGLLADHQTELARGVVENLVFEVEHYGGVLNANRSYYLTRSQPPFLAAMIRLIAADKACFRTGQSGERERRQWLERAYRAAAKDYATWLRPEHRAGDTGLARYYDYGEGPVPEMADASSYYRDVLRALVDHPQRGTQDFLVRGAEFPDAAEAAQLAGSSCDIHRSPVCARAWYKGYRLSRDFYAGDRAMRESGFDTSDRFGAFSGATHHYAPVCLNSLLYRYEQDMAQLAAELGEVRDVTLWKRRAEARQQAINRYLWQPGEGYYADYDFVHAKPSEYAFLTAFDPLWAGAASPQQAEAMRDKLSWFERSGGLMTSTRETGLQWDAPYGWAPLQWMTAAGLRAYGYDADARRIATRFNTTVDEVFAADGTIREKYDVTSGSAKFTTSAGYTQNVVGFGWTNGVYLKLHALIAGRE